MSQYIQITKWNSKRIALLAVLAALGIVLRSISITVIPDIVQLTPGFFVSEFAGMVLGLEGGIIVGAITGIVGAMQGGEFPLIPLIGNIALGVSTAIVYLFMRKDSRVRDLMVVISAGIIGGFLPTFCITLMFIPITTEGIALAAFSAMLDFFQAALWAIVGLPIKRIVDKDILGVLE
ncbi:MAG: ECF transporter S component [Candidatus Asgardarchaeia archaeon]